MKKTILIIASIIIALSAFFISSLEFREEYIPISIFFMIALCIPTYYFFIKKTNTKRAIITLLALSIFSMIIETIGVITGFPYGFFTYTDKLGGSVGVIPWTVSFGWVPLVIAAWTIAQERVKKTGYELIKKIILGAFILMLFDVVLDPGSVALNFWEWHPPGIFYGVPLSNYAGWIFSGIIGMLIITLIMKKEKPSNDFLITAYLGNTFWTVVTLTNGMIVPGIVGIIITTYLSKKIYTQRKTQRKTKKKVK